VKNLFRFIFAVLRYNGGVRSDELPALTLPFWRNDMTPRKLILPPFDGCICGDPNCQIPHGLCHCGCGGKTTIPDESDASKRAIRGVPRKYIHGHNSFREAKLPDNLCVCRNHDCEIPFGYCHCGCGERTRIAPTNNTEHGWVRGYPILFINGHCLADRVDLSKCECPEGARLVALTFGKVAIVDDGKYESINSHKWHTIGNRKRKTPNIYAGRTEVINGNLVTILMHNEIFGLEYGDDRKVDHVNRNGLDNLLANLRLADCSQNAWNQGRNSINTSGFKGVSWDKKEHKWKARIAARGRRYFLGYFDSKEAAYAAYCEKAKELHGEFANLG